MPEELKDWNDVVKRNLAGHAEWQNPPGEMIFNGPVEQMWIDDSGSVHVKMRWIAHMPYPGQSGYGKWKKYQAKVWKYPFLVL